MKNEKRMWLCVTALAGSIAAHGGGLWIDRASAAWNALDDTDLKRKAAVALTNAAQTVTAKKRLPPSGDRHDYMSFGPYWWPDPSKPDGLPFIRRDGETNPESLADSDRMRFERMIDDVELLAAAAARFGDRAAGAEAARKLRVFFLDPDTAMSPHLKYGQAIPGRCDGRGIGLIDTRFFATHLIDALTILEETGDLSAADLAGMKKWFGAYLDWMTTSPIGLDEADEHNNHGTAYDLQAAGLALYIGRNDLARKILSAVPARRIDTQIAPDGSQPHELARTRSFSYSVMNATLFCHLALLGEKAGVDLWGYTSSDGRAIFKAVKWLAPYCDGDKKWTHRQITPVAPGAGRDMRKVFRRFFPRGRPLPDLRVSANRRFLATADGKPFFYLADTAWELFHRLTREEAVRYLDNRAKLGYTAVQSVAIAELDGVNTPNAYGHRPFVDGKGATPAIADGPGNDYWDHVDFIVREANKRGLYVALLPTWGRWWKENNLFTPDTARAYGRYLAQRYRGDSVIWVLGGDRLPDKKEEAARIDAMAEGLAFPGPYDRHLITFHPRGGGGSAEWFHGRPWLDFNMRQNGHGIDCGRYAELTTRDYLRADPVKPVIDGEPVYEGHPIAFDPDRRGHTVAADVRRALYWDLFHGMCGHTYGHHSVWQMHGAEKSPGGGKNRPLMPWHEAIDEPGAAQMRHAKDLLLAHDFFTRIPDRSLIVPDAVKSLVPGTGTRLFAATRDHAGTYAFVYAPVGRAFTVSFKNLPAPRYRAAWMNPRDGSYSDWETFDRPETRRFTPPAPGEILDWVLVLEAQ